VVAFAVAILTVGVLAASASAAADQIPYSGGPVLHSSAPYLVFWAPSGESIPSGSQSLIARFLTDTAADSGKSTSVFGVLRQYYDAAGFADYRQTFNAARQVIVDPQPYPPPGLGCSSPDGAYPTCITDSQIKAELQRLIVADRLPAAGSLSAPELRPDAPVYFVVLPADVDVCDPMSCASNKFCGYHQWFVDTHNDIVLYAVLPLQPLRDGSLLVPSPKGDCQIDGTSATQTPNGDVNADILISQLSHEYSETITDPHIPFGWDTASPALEVGDKCNVNAAAQLPQSNPDAFLPTLGGSEPAGSLYTQLINGHRYYTQSEWSNGDHGCEMRPSLGRIVPRFTVPRRANKAGGWLTFSPAASTSKNALSSATWNFGDGSPRRFSTEKPLTPAKHRYRKAGRYTVTLTLVDNRGNVQTTTRGVTVHPHRT
jgi:PKD domain